MVTREMKGSLFPPLEIMNAYLCTFISTVMYNDRKEYELYNYIINYIIERKGTGDRFI